MSDDDMFDAARAAGGPIEQAVAVFMLHPETFAESAVAGYRNPLAGYVAGRGGVLGEASGVTVSSVFVVFEPNVVAAAPDAGLPLYAGWRTMALADDAPARALQLMFVLRELRGGVHFNTLSISGVSPVEAHMLNKGLGWPEPFADGANKKARSD